MRRRHVKPEDESRRRIFGAPTYSQYVLQGAILIVAVGLSSLGRFIAES